MVTEISNQDQTQTSEFIVPLWLKSGERGTDESE